MPQHPSAADFPALLRALSEAGVEFIVVGGAAAVIQGAPITTTDLDIVHKRTSDNVGRLLALLLGLDATMRYDLAKRGLRPTTEMLLGTGHVNLSTTLGPIDPLCELGVGQGYEELLSHVERIASDGRTLQVLDLPTLIDVKTKAGRAKDRLILPILLATLDERSRAG
jgi:hypothetical protein